MILLLMNDADTYADAGFPADAAACVAANDPAAANSADAETVVDYAADVDTPSCGC